MPELAAGPQSQIALSDIFQQGFGQRSLIATPANVLTTSYIVHEILHHIDIWAGVFRDNRLLYNCTLCQVFSNFSASN
jgi:hypothetical protein